MPVVVALLLVSLLYVTSYLALVQPRSVGMLGKPPWRTEARYRVGGSAAQKLFGPINYVDRQVRRDYWLQYE
jgi:hypothetical protein